MKNTYIIIIVLVLILVGGWLLMSKSKKAEAPTPIEDVGVNAEIPAPGPEQTVATKEFTVEGKNFSFTPSTISVNKGDTVKITFKATQGFHDFRIDGYGVGTKQMQSPGEETIEFVANKAGSFEYYCSVGSHRQMGMKGTLIVAE